MEGRRKEMQWWSGKRKDEVKKKKKYLGLELNQDHSNSSDLLPPLLGWLPSMTQCASHYTTQAVCSLGSRHLIITFTDR